MTCILSITYFPGSIFSDSTYVRIIIWVLVPSEKETNKYKVCKYEHINVSMRLKLFLYSISKQLNCKNCSSNSFAMDISNALHLHPLRCRKRNIPLVSTGFVYLPGLFFFSSSVNIALQTHTRIPTFLLSFLHMLF